MLGYAHNKCNLKYKFKKDNVNDDYLINVFAQNFDQSFLIRKLKNLDNKMPFSCLPRNSNKFISLKIGPSIFKDSYLFLNKSLDYLTKTIDDNDRKSSKQEFGENYLLLTKKGIYPHDYFDYNYNLLNQVNGGQIVLFQRLQFTNRCQPVRSAALSATSSQKISWLTFEAMAVRSAMSALMVSKNLSLGLPRNRCPPSGT